MKAPLIARNPNIKIERYSLEKEFQSSCRTWCNLEQSFVFQAKIETTHSFNN